MKPQRFETEILPGHKEDAAEVPFDPERAWGIPPQRLWHGRRGHPVRGRLNGIRFESCIVPRSKRFWLLLDTEVERAAGVAAGDRVVIELEPRIEMEQRSAGSKPTRKRTKSRSTPSVRKRSSA